MVAAAAVGAMERGCGRAAVAGFKCVLGAVEGAAAAEVRVVGIGPVSAAALTAATEPRPFRRGCVVVTGPVHALNALVPVDDLEDLTDEGTGLFSSILVQREGQSSVPLL